MSSPRGTYQPPASCQTFSHPRQLEEDVVEFSIELPLQGNAAAATELEQIARTIGAVFRATMQLW